ncbi:phage tail tape measure protein [Yanghanlia caeni]|uniref:Phage tail tape measure protein n=1 Tax=Yanghanlia caeni TaxID=3064283 RepID=A0ABU1D560_9BURK|nr:phage tail tape measure protein [Alcaligenaceae bacterium LG-2]
MATAHPVQISIGATLAASLGSAVRSAQAQLNQLGSTMAELGNKQSGIKQLESLRQQAIEAGKAWQEAQDKIRQLQQAKASGQWSTKGLDAARARVSALEAKAADPALSEAKRARAAAALETARQRLAEQEAKAEARYARQLDHLVEKAGKAKTAYEQIKASVANLTTELQKSGVATNKLASEQAHLGSTMETLRARTEALTRAQQAQASNLEQRSAYRAQMMDAVALGGALYGLVQPAVQFESVMADVKKVVNFDTPDQFGQMSKDVLELSTRIPMAADGIGAIVAAAGQAGIARHELVRFAEDAAKMGVAFDLSGQQAGAAMTGLRSIFGSTQDEVVKLGDAINHLSNNMDAKASDLLNIANRSGSTAKLIGLSGAQLSALGATFLALKTPPEVAATGINALLMKLATADKQSEKFQQALAQLGLSAKELKKDIARDAQGTLINFLEAVKGAPDVMGTLSDLFGAEYSDDIAKLVGSLDTYRQAIGLVADETAYAGSMQKEYEARAATTANNLQLLKNQISRLGITIGNALLPPLNSLLGALMAPIGALAQLAERFPVVTQVVVGTIGAVLALKVATIALGYAWTFVKGPILGAQVAFQSVRAGLALLQAQAAATGASAGILSLAWARIKMGALGLITPIKSAALAFWSMLPAIGATTTALLANPITWIVAGIGVAVAGLALVIRKYWDPIAAYVGGVFQGIRAAVQPAITSLTTALAPLAPIGQAVASVFGFIADGVSRVVGWIGQLLAPVTLSKDEFDSLSASGQSLGTVIGSVLSAAFTALTFPIRAVGTLVGWVMEGFRWLVSFSPLAALQAAWQPLSGFFGGLWASVVSGAQSAWQQLTAALGSFAPLQALQSVIGSMLTALRDLPGQFMSLGSSLLQGLAQGVRNAAEQAVAAVGEVAARVRDRFKAMLGIHSPSRVFATLGSALSLGLAQGVAAAGPAVVSEVGRLTQSLQAVPLSLANPDVVSPAQGLRLPSPDRPSMGLAVAPHTPGAPSIHFAPQITIHAPPGSDPQALADLLDSRLRSLIRDALRGSSAALHD